MRSIVARYYWAIRFVIKQQPELKKYLTCCRHCQILFFTHPRNAGRNDLGCPFGCREARRRQKSTERSVAYNRSKDGKDKKVKLNQRRNQIKDIPASTTDRSVGSKVEADRTILFHIQMVISLIEGYWVVLKNIKALVAKLLRQHSIDLEKNIFYQYQVPP
ncbi:MAG: hypothetical protein GY841_23185 [FCB group bacterium]|nr:hypothetical protein [FCB group bacterium]